MSNETGTGRVEGWKGIAAELGVGVTKAQVLATRERDPLPVHRDHLGIYEMRDVLAAWLARQNVTYLEHRASLTTESLASSSGTPSPASKSA
jgi:hypothetical protein